MSSHGQFIWNELNTHDVETAKTFFGTTIGWTFDPMPMEDGVTYWVIKMGETRVGGLFVLSGPMFDQVPDHWLAYLSVDDIDKRVAGLAAAGGTMLRPPWTVPGVGRMAILKAPGGAIMAWMTPSMPTP